MKLDLLKDIFLKVYVKVLVPYFDMSHEKLTLCTSLGVKFSDWEILIA